MNLTVPNRTRRNPPPAECQLQFSLELAGGGHSQKRGQLWIDLIEDLSVHDLRSILIGYISIQEGSGQQGAIEIALVAFGIVIEIPIDTTAHGKFAATTKKTTRCC